MTAALALCACASSPEPLADDLLPTGWRRPIVAELTNENAIARASVPAGFTMVREDFDGDGRMDRADLLVHDGTRTWGAFVFYGGDTFKMLASGPSEEVGDFGVAVQAKGPFRTTCKSPDCPGDTMLPTPGVEVFQFDGGSSVYIYDGDGGFTRLRKHDDR
jgi:hypothetical protein